MALLDPPSIPYSILTKKIGRNQTCDILDKVLRVYKPSKNRDTKPEFLKASLQSTLAHVVTEVLLSLLTIP